MALFFLFFFLLFSLPCFLPPSTSPALPNLRSSCPSTDPSLPLSTPTRFSTSNPSVPCQFHLVSHSFSFPIISFLDPFLSRRQKICRQNIKKRKNKDKHENKSNRICLSLTLSLSPSISFSFSPSLSLFICLLNYFFRVWTFCRLTSTSFGSFSQSQVCTTCCSFF